jgi:hypothetical protein
MIEHATKIYTCALLDEQIKPCSNIEDRHFRQNYYEAKSITTA